MNMEEKKKGAKRDSHNRRYPWVPGKGITKEPPGEKE